MVNLFDKNGDNKISLNEFSKIIQGKSRTSEMYMELKCGKNKDGKRMSISQDQPVRIPSNIRPSGNKMCKNIDKDSPRTDLDTPARHAANREEPNSNPNGLFKFSVNLTHTFNDPNDVYEVEQPKKVQEDDEECPQQQNIKFVGNIPMRDPKVINIKSQSCDSQPDVTSGGGFWCCKKKSTARMNQVGIEGTVTKCRKNTGYCKDIYGVQPVPGEPVNTEDDGQCGGDKSMITVMKNVIFYWLKETRTSIIQITHRGGLLRSNMIGTFKRLSKEIVITEDRNRLC
jgi:hypothetical protein